MILNAAGGGMDAGSKLGIAAEGAAAASARWLDFLAQQEITSGKQQADIITKRGDQQRSAARASYAAAGIKVDTGGSAQAVDEYIAATASQDALSALIDSTRKASGMRLDAKLQRIAGKAQRQAGYLNAATSLLGTGAQISNNWGTPANRYSTGSYQGNLPTRGGA